MVKGLGVMGSRLWRVKGVGFMVYGLVEQYHSAESGAEELRRHVEEVPRPPQPAPVGG